MPCRSPLVRRGSSRRRQAGVAALEFVLVIPIVLLLVLGVIQIAQGYITRVAIDYAAAEAARAAVVWWYEFELDGLTDEWGPIHPDEARLVVEQRIHAAAALALVPVAPATNGEDQPESEAYRLMSERVGAIDAPLPIGHEADTLFGSFDDPVVPMARVGSKLRYAFHATRVQVSRLEDDRVSIEIAFAMPSSIPVAGIAYGRSLRELGDWQSTLERAGLDADAHVRVLVARTTVTLAPRPNP